MASEAFARIAFIFSAFDGRPFFFVGVGSLTNSITGAGAASDAAAERTPGSGFMGPFGRGIEEGVWRTMSRIDGGGGILVRLIGSKTDILSKE